MDPRIAFTFAALAAIGTPLAAFGQAAAPVPPANAAQGTSSPVALPPQNYGAQPGFFRNAPEMAAFGQPQAGIVMTPPPPAPPVPPPAPAPVAVVAPAVAAPAASAVVPPQRVPDPTQNLQWAEQQMDRAETTAVQQRQVGTAPPPVAPGAYNGATNPADR